MHLHSTMCTFTYVKIQHYGMTFYLSSNISVFLYLSTWLIVDMHLDTLKLPNTDIRTRIMCIYHQLVSFRVADPYLYHNHLRCPYPSRFPYAQQQVDHNGASSLPGLVCNELYCPCLGYCVVLLPLQGCDHQIYLYQCEIL